MHDILEGVLQYEIKEMLKNYIKVEHYLTLEVLNSRISKYDFGYYNDKNRPSPITEQKLSSNDKNLKQHGMYSKLKTWELCPDILQAWTNFAHVF